MSDTFPEPTTLPPEAAPAPEPEPGWRTWASWIVQGLRAAVLRPVQGLPGAPTPWQMLGITLVTVALVTGAGRWELAGPVSFVPRAWLLGWASTAFLLFGIWLALGWGRAQARHPAPVAAWMLLYWVATTPLALASVGLSALAAQEWLPDWWLNTWWMGWVVLVVLTLWLLGLAWRITAALNGSHRVLAAVLVCVLVVQSADIWLLRVHAWQSDDTASQADEPPTLVLSQEVFETQQDLLEKALDGLRPSEPGAAIQVFGLVYAPYAQDVFLRESTMVQSVLEQRFAAQGRVLRLVNHPSTAAELPWATNQNLADSLQALAQVMNKDRDVLVLYLTSHGGADFRLAASHWPLEVEDLTADQLRELLDDLGIRNRVIAVSACFSGGWIEPLQGDGTLVMTAADKDHTSYGCGSKSELTFFGRAVFDEQLRSTASFEEAFHAAVPIIQQREVEGRKSDGFSNPQIAVGAGIRTVLQQWAQQHPPSSLAKP